MILESYYWKKELKLLIKDYLQFLSHKREYSESVGVKIETLFFISCFIVRKISEANKLSDEIMFSSLPAKRYDNIKKFRSYMDRCDIDEHFDLAHPKQINLSIRDVLNFGIHSFTFEFRFTNAEALKKSDFSVYINSDRIKNTYLYELPIRNYINFLLLVAKDNIVSMRMVYDDKIGEMKYLFKSNRIK